MSRYYSKKMARFGCSLSYNQSKERPSGTVAFLFDIACSAVATSSCMSSVPRGEFGFARDVRLSYPASTRPFCTSRLTLMLTPGLLSFRPLSATEFTHAVNC